MRQFFLAITRNTISFAGSALTTASAVLFICMFGIELLGYRGGPYLGIITFLVLPALFIFGLLLIPVGTLVARRRARRAAARGEALTSLPVIDLNSERTRRLVLAFVVFTVVNIVILALATYKGVHVMDSTEFCGQACHTVMAPEYATYQRSAHARVKCVSCHIGPGAGWFVKSKLSGSWQVLAVAFDLYPRPISTPVHSLRPARETCEECHWPTKFVGDRLKVITHYAEDEPNTERKTILLLPVGGMQARTSHGIHWHVDPAIQIRYQSDSTREVIHTVELRRENGRVDVYRLDSPDAAESVDGARSAGAAQAGNSGGHPGSEAASTAERRHGAEGEEGEWRVMDCVDCHNRPSHVHRMPEEEIDAALQQGRIDRSLPYIRREGLKALKVSYASHEQARTGLADAIRSFYKESYPELFTSRTQAVESAARTLGDIYCTNVFPWMNVTWGTYPNHLGHQYSTGCWRCHDEMHKTSDGRAISMDCSLCHAILANEEENPAILQQLNP